LSQDIFVNWQSLKLQATSCGNCANIKIKKSMLKYYFTKGKKWKQKKL
jgi:hypothetical protein